MCKQNEVKIVYFMIHLFCDTINEWVGYDNVKGIPTAHSGMEHISYTYSTSFLLIV